MKICLTDFILDMNRKETEFHIPTNLSILGIRLDDTKLETKSDKCRIVGYPRETEV